MNRIKSIKQLQSEKQQMLQNKERLAKQLKENWQELKVSAKPANLVTGIFHNVMKKKTTPDLENDNVLKRTLTYGVSLLGKRFIEKVEKKFKTIFKKA